MSIRKRFFLAGLVLSTAACASTVEQAPSTTTTTPLGGSGGAVSTTTTSTTSGGGSGGSGGEPIVWADPLGDPSCAPGEAAIVAATSGVSASAAVDLAGAWSMPYPLDPTTSLAAYVDPYLELGVFWLDAAGDGRSTRTLDGVAYDPVSGPSTFAPLSGASFSVLRSPEGLLWMVGSDAEGIRVASFDPDAFDWIALPGASTAFWPEFSATLAGGDIVVAGRGMDGTLCDQTYRVALSAWDAPHCDPTIVLAHDAEIPVAGPVAVGFPNGDLALVYKVTNGQAIEGRWRHAGEWSWPSTLTSNAVGVTFAATATAAGNVLVGLASLEGRMSTVAFQRPNGDVPPFWSQPIAFDPFGFEGGPIAMAPGICGDDALMAYGRLGPPDGSPGTGVARVRGTGAAWSRPLGGGLPMRGGLSIATRQAGP
jgi:hypothetical protein